MLHDVSTLTYECFCFALLILNAFLCFRQWRYVGELMRQESARDDYHLMQDVDDGSVSQIRRPVRSSRPRSRSSPIDCPSREADAQEARQPVPIAGRGKDRRSTNESRDAGIVCSSMQKRQGNPDSPASCSNLATSPHRVLKSSSHASKSCSDLYDSHSPALASHSSRFWVEDMYIEDQVEEDQVESGNREADLTRLVHQIHHDGKARIFPRRPSQDSPLSHNVHHASRENELAGNVFSRSNSSSFNSNSSLGGTSGSSKRVSSASRYTAQLLQRRSRSGSLSPLAKDWLKTG
jgi:hypothetical protein